MAANVVLEVTLTITPEPRDRICGTTAWVIAMTPNVLVSNSSRAVLMGVASNAPIPPIPALLTRTSTGPLALTALAMLSGSVTSSGNTVSRSEAGKTSGRGVRMVATTSQPSSRNLCAVARP